MKKSKIKEPSYQTVASKGGGLVRIYTATVSPLEHRVAVVCSKKSSVSEVVATALAKCGKHDLDPKRCVCVCVCVCIWCHMTFVLLNNIHVHV